MIGSLLKNQGFTLDEVMADRGFTIGEELFSSHVGLNIPSFLRGYKKTAECRHDCFPL